MTRRPGQYYDRARSYDAALGRFMSLDPTGFGAGDTDLYRYVANDVMVNTDPSGLDEEPQSKGSDPSQPPSTYVPAGQSESMTATGKEAAQTRQGTRSVMGRGRPPKRGPATGSQPYNPLAPYETKGQDAQQQKARAKQQQQGPQAGAAEGKKIAELNAKLIQSMEGEIAALKALAEARAEILTLKAQLAQQQAQIDALKQRLDAIEKASANAPKASPTHSP